MSCFFRLRAHRLGREENGAKKEEKKGERNRRREVPEMR